MSDPTSSGMSLIERAGRQRVWVLALLVTALVLASLCAAGTGRGQGRGFAYSMELTGVIERGSERELERGLQAAQEKGARLVIVRLDTPGGSVASMREMVKRLIGARLPVIVYVAPDGASAGSAGVFITVAGDVAAMAPQTNIGSATPVLIGPGGPLEVSGDLERKAQNDLAAYARALAEGHGRNAKLAERMVRESLNVTARAARRDGLIDIVAPSERALLRRLNGFRIRGRKARVLDTDGLRVVRSDFSEPADKGLDESGDGGLLFGLSPVGLAGITLLALGIALVLREKYGLRLRHFRRSR